MTIHNFSNITLTNQELQLLSKGLSFTPTPTIPPHKAHLNILKEFDNFSRTLRQKFTHAQYHPYYKKQHVVQRCNTSHIYRRIKFLPSIPTTSLTQQYSGIGTVEHYIALTKNNLNDKLKELTTHTTTNITDVDKKVIQKLKQARQTITIKPADKNLGIVILDTDDYITQCMKQLSDTNTYRPATEYPKDNIRRQIHNIVYTFKTQLHDYNKKLYTLLLSEPPQSRTPQFYGIPKIHKKFTRVLPIRPIVSQCSSILSPTARFIDHVLQPLAQTYPDYIQNSTALSIILQDLVVQDNAILVAADVVSLYPSIPQTDMLNVIYEEMITHRHLLPFDPNLIIKLLHLNINHTYFEFASTTFQQIKGTAMGAPFSPTVANIYMSVTIKKFLATQAKKPLLTARYIDDIFIIWEHSNTDLSRFINNLNTFNPALRYTHEHSTTSIDFLDLTIFKSTDKNTLDTKTFQKPHNLYQYLHYSSYHQKSTFKAIITGELTRYVRTNTTEDNYTTIKKLFKTRLITRGYPERLIDKTMTTVQYNRRQQLLNMTKQQQQQQRLFPPLYKCLPPPQYKSLKKIVMDNYNPLQKTLPAPRFLTRKYPNLHNLLVRTQLQPTENQIIDIHLQLNSDSDSHIDSTHTTAGEIPRLRQGVRTQKCRHPRCITCKHLNCNKYFTSTKTGTTYTIRHNFNCTSSNLIYLITCKHCKKQYVGLTTKQLNVRINHHRSSIINHKPIYLSNHFNFEDHALTDITVQPIDKPTTNDFTELQTLEKYWIHTLKTIQPLGLNVSTGQSSAQCHPPSSHPSRSAHLSSSYQ